MRKLAAVLCLTAVCTFVGCGGESTAPEMPENPAPAPEGDPTGMDGDDGGAKMEDVGLDE